jgi:hypothetical protein
MGVQAGLVKGALHCRHLGPDSKYHSYYWRLGSIARVLSLRASRHLRVGDRSIAQQAKALVFQYRCFDNTVDLRKETRG